MKVSDSRSPLEFTADDCLVVLSNVIVLSEGTKAQRSYVTMSYQLAQGEALLNIERYVF